MAVRFFVSYKRNDPDTERLLPPLRKALEGFRYNVFFKYRVFQDLDIDGGEKWKKELNRNIECADEFLLLLSAAAAESRYVQDEVRFADFFRTPANRKPRILPIYINVEKSENAELKQILNLDDLEHLNWKSEKDTPNVISEVRRLVRK